MKVLGVVVSALLGGAVFGVVAALLRPRHREAVTGYLPRPEPGS